MKKLIVIIMCMLAVPVVRAQSEGWKKEARQVLRTSEPMKKVVASGIAEEKITDTMLDTLVFKKNYVVAPKERTGHFDLLVERGTSGTFDTVTIDTTFVVNVVDFSKTDMATHWPPVEGEVPLFLNSGASKYGYAIVKKFAPGELKSKVADVADDGSVDTDTNNDKQEAYASSGRVEVLNESNSVLLSSDERVLAWTNANGKIRVNRGYGFGYTNYGLYQPATLYGGFGYGGGFGFGLSFGFGWGFQPYYQPCFSCGSLCANRWATGGPAVWNGYSLVPINWYGGSYVYDQPYVYAGNGFGGWNGTYNRPFGSGSGLHTSTNLPVFKSGGGQAADARAVHTVPVAKVGQRDLREQLAVHQPSRATIHAKPTAVGQRDVRASHQVNTASRKVPTTTKPSRQPSSSGQVNRAASQQSRVVTRTSPNRTSRQTTVLARPRQDQPSRQRVNTTRTPSRVVPQRAQARQVPPRTTVRQAVVQRAPQGKR